MAGEGGSGQGVGRPPRVLRMLLLGLLAAAPEPGDVLNLWCFNCEH
eukprot:COSAG01_NODE_64225_length_277_cov_0.859551_1_plen_45_part_10